jgi:hypothetical protein
LLANEFVRRLATPEIDSRDLKKLARGAAEELDQGAAVRPLAGLGGETQKQFLKLLVGSRDWVCLGQRHGVAAETVQRVIGGGWRGFVIHKLLNIRGNYAVISF